VIADRYRLNVNQPALDPFKCEFVNNCPNPDFTRTLPALFTCITATKFGMVAERQWLCIWSVSHGGRDVTMLTS
jgi:hypothetical protein